MTNFGENIARKEETVVGLFQSAVIFDFLMNLYKLGLKLKLNKISNRRHLVLIDNAMKFYGDMDQA
jgi:hypothetical protein